MPRRKYKDEGVYDEYIIPAVKSIKNFGMDYVVTPIKQFINPRKYNIEKLEQQTKRRPIIKKKNTYIKNTKNQYKADAIKDETLAIWAKDREKLDLELKKQNEIDKNRKKLVTELKKRNENVENRRKKYIDELLYDGPVVSDSKGNKYYKF